MAQREHGGGIAAAAALYGGQPSDWLDLSTGINPAPYPVAALPSQIWARLPDYDAFATLEAAARRYYNVPEGLEIVPASGASALIQIMPRLADTGQAVVVSPTYNEHSAAFRAEGWQIDEAPHPKSADALVLVSPNNPDGRIWRTEDIKGFASLTIIDESFADPMPETSLVRQTFEGAIILRSFGKFFGLAGVRLGFAIAQPDLAEKIRTMLGPWAVSGPAIEIGRQAMSDEDWISQTRTRLDRDAERLRALLGTKGMAFVGGTPLFVTVKSTSAAQIAERLAHAQILVRPFSYAPDWLRFGLPGTEADWARLEAAL